MVEDLEKYHVHIMVDWGILNNGALWVVPSVSGALLEQYESGCQQNWDGGMWSIDELRAVNEGVHIMVGGVATLGGDFMSLAGSVTVIRESGTQPLTDPGLIHYRVDPPKDDFNYDLASFIHEMGHIVTAHNPQTLNYFMTQLGAKCNVVNNTFAGLPDCNTQTSYDPGIYSRTSSDRLRYLPSEYATHGNMEDYAETWRYVVLSAYLFNAPRGPRPDLQDAYLAYNGTEFPLFHHDIGMRSLVMKDIINGSWRNGNGPRR